MMLDTIRKQAFSFSETNLSGAIQIVDGPRDDDILCGKDKRCMTHKGSVFFRKVIDEYKDTYRRAANRSGKMAVTKKVFDLLQSRRFLKLNEEFGYWEVLHPSCIRDKIGHALRFANRESKRKIRAATTKKKSNQKKSTARPSHQQTNCSTEKCSPRPSAASPVCITELEEELMRIQGQLQLLLANTQSQIQRQMQMQVPTLPGPKQVTGQDEQEQGEQRDLMWMMQAPIMEEAYPTNNIMNFA